MISGGQVEKAKLLELFGRIEGDLYRFPAVDPVRLRSAVEGL